MSRYQAFQLESVSQLRDASSRWDNLWQRSEVVSPAARAEALAQWYDHFMPKSPFRALVVEDRDANQWVAALPLVEVRSGRFLYTGQSMVNEWAPDGDLLLATDTTADAVLDVLVRALRDVPWRLLWLSDMALDSPRWTSMQRAVARAGVAIDRHLSEHVGLIEIGDDWEAFLAGLSKKHRKKMARCNRRLAEKGDVRLERFRQFEPDQIEPLLRKAFEIEDRSWKGENNSSVLRLPGMFEFYLRRSQLLAAWGQLELAFLYVGQEPIAFIYGYAAKGVSQWQKIGYDPKYAACTPGQLLQYHLLERLHAEKTYRAVDTVGTLTPALAKWNPVPYPAGRLAIAARGLAAGPLLYVTKRSLPLVQYLRAMRASKA